MKFYKFKSSLSPEPLDIILNNRLYCARYRSLNDPLEGLLGFLPWHGIEREDVNVQRLQEIYGKIARHYLEVLDPFRICSLSLRWNHPLMWVHYANSFQGVCLEVELSSDDPQLHKVQYEGTVSAPVVSDPQGFLTRKLDCWCYEEEYRIISDQEYYELKTPVSRVIVGNRIAKPALEVLIKLATEKKFELALASIVGSGEVKLS